MMWPKFLEGQVPVRLLGSYSLGSSHLGLLPSSPSKLVKSIGSLFPSQDKTPKTFFSYHLWRLGSRMGVGGWGDGGWGGGGDPKRTCLPQLERLRATFIHEPIGLFIC